MPRNRVSPAAGQHDGHARRRLGDRWRALVSRLRGHTGSVAVVVVLAVLATMVAVGSGYHPRAPHTVDGGAWLGSLNGRVVHVNGTSAKVDWTITTDSGLFSVVQDGAGGFVDGADRLHSIDRAAMDLSHVVTLGSGSPTVATGGGRAYVVYQSTGTVQQFDPATLHAVGPTLALGKGVTSAAVDGQGVLYALLAGSGTVSVVRSGQVLEQLEGGSGKGEQLVLVGSTVVDVDPGNDTMTTLGASGGVRAVTLGVATGTRLIMPSSVSAAPLWMSDPGDSSVIAVDPSKGLTDRVQVGLDGPTWGAPQPAGRFVYLYEQSTGSVVTVDSRTGRVSRQALFVKGVRVSLFGKDGLAWGNDFAGPRVFVADATGSVKVFYKYLPKPGGIGLFKRAHKKVRPIHHKAKKVKKRPTHHHRTFKKHKVKKKPKVKTKPKPKPTSTTTASTTTTAPTTTTTLPVCTTTTTGSTTTTTAATTTTAPCREPTTTTTTTPCPTTTTSSSTSTTAGDTTTTTGCDATTTTTAAPPP